MTSDQPLGAIAVLSGLKDVDLAFAEIARWLRQQPGFRRSSHSVHMSRRPAAEEVPAALVIAFYSDAVHESECGVDFVLELTSAGGEWLIESSVRGGGRDRDDVVHEFPDRMATAANRWTTWPVSSNNS
jgi:hypothetical protein